MDADGGKGRKREACLVRKHREFKSDTETHAFQSSCSSLRAVPFPLCHRGERPTSSFVYPGMWDVLTGWLFIDSAQLRVPTVALSLDLSCVYLCVCVSTPLSVLSDHQTSHRQTGSCETQARECAALRGKLSH